MTINSNVMIVIAIDADDHHPAQDPVRRDDHHQPTASDRRCRRPCDFIYFSREIIERFNYFICILLQHFINY